MIIVDELCSRQVFRTIIIDFPVSDAYDPAIASQRLYDYAMLHENRIPFLHDMVLWHDIIVSHVCKPQPQGSAISYGVITARLTELIVTKHADGSTNVLQHQFLDCVRSLLAEGVLDPAHDDVVPISPLVTVYNNSADCFNLV